MSDDVKNQQKINALLAEEKLLNEQIQQQAADGNSQSEPDLNTARLRRYNSKFLIPDA